ncbi:MAG: histidinol dehydrogenase [Firmicutes bacterium]|nr:histidinol dehydrogenase [Bacillota bacterium]
MRTIKAAKERTAEDRAKLRDAVSEIITRVIEEGDEALKGYNEKFDECFRDRLRISREEIEEAYAQVEPEILENIKKAAANIEAFAKEQKAALKTVSGFEPVPGLELGHSVIPMDSVCCYVPGGGYPLYSTALMLGIPAKVAGVKRIAACSPTVKGTGKIHPKTLVALDIAGVDEIYAVGGAQAVAAFSYGTEEIEKVTMIVGPGNSFVTEAKRQCFGQVGIDFLAGPSEVLVIADETADPEIIAADILAQSEHDPVAKGILVTTDETVAEKTIQAVEKQLETLETRGIAERSWKDYGEVILSEDLDEAVEYANSYAPEHLEVCVAEEREHGVFSALRNYGSLFLGQNTAEVFGDYASGTNHTLPTMGAARYTGGIWTGTFLKVCTYQKSDEKAMKELIPVVSSLAKGEGLAGHANAADIRKK